MPKGTKNYFRHSFFANQSKKLNDFMSFSDIGKSGYFYYFSLLEICGPKMLENKDNVVTIHRQSIKKVWGKWEESCNKVLTKMQQSDLISITFLDHSYKITIPNALEYLGSYGKYAPQIKENKIKESKIKENKVKENRESTNKKKQFIKFDFKNGTYEIDYSLLDEVKWELKYIEKEKYAKEWADAFLSRAENEKKYTNYASTMRNWAIREEKRIPQWEKNRIDEERNKQEAIKRLTGE